MVYLANLIFVIFLAVACNSGGGGGSEDLGPTWGVQGTITYDRVEITSSGLNYATGTTQEPVRNVYIEARRSSDNKKVGSTYTDNAGAFSMQVPQKVTEYYIAVYSRLKSPDFSVIDNTNKGAIYLAASANIQNTQADTILPNINLQSGWTGTNTGGSYTKTRAAAPFAILDSIYSAVLKIKADRPSVNFPSLKINWSKNNIALGNNPEIGQIGTSHYDPEKKQLYILGREDSDTDEYDKHIVVHEFGHYIEDRLGRSDSIGGEHGVGDLLAISVAFGEAWGNSFSAMTFDPDITYLDSMSTRQQSIGVSMNMESDSDPNKGWFSEVSIQEILFDIYDSNNESGDDLTMGIGPVMDVLMNEHKSTPALTSVFTFITALKTRYPAEVTKFDDLVATKDIAPIQDIYGTGETNDGGMSQMLPVYRSLALGGAVGTTQLGGNSYRYNEAENTRYYRFTAASSRTRITWTSSDTFYLFIFNKGKIVLEGGDTSSGSPLSGAQDITTTSGQQYVIQVTTIPEWMNGTGPISFGLSVQQR